MILLAVPALDFSASSINYPDQIKIQAGVLIIIPCLALLHSVLSRRHSLAWSVYWMWSLVFLGLASSYQLVAGQFPWLGALREDDISAAQQLVILGHLVAIGAYAVISARREQDRPTSAVSLGDSPRLASSIMTAIWIHAGIATVFVVLMGPGMVSGRKAYQAQLLSYGGIPAFGTLYFLAVVGSIIIPAMAIYLRKSGLGISKGPIVMSVLVSFIATNPLVGSRFMTGSFLVAVSAALLSDRGRRWLPLGVIGAFVTVFPTLDLLRGDGTGASKVAFSPPAETLTTFDYDSFEMIVREVSLGGNLTGDVSRLDLIIAPFLRWVPILSQGVQGDASGPAVAAATGMGFTNVSMPLWAEADLFGSVVGVIIVFSVLGALLSRSGSTTLYGGLIETPVAAMLFIILRGSLYEVLGYILLALAVGGWLAAQYRKDQAEESAATHKTGVRVLHRLPAVRNARQH